jgi:hypothetical protein
MVSALLISFDVYFSVAFVASAMLIYHDITAPAYSRERSVAILLELCRTGLSVAGLYAIAVDLRLSSEVFLYDAFVICSLQLFVGNNVG